MDFILHLRYLSARDRGSGTCGKGPKPYTEDKQKNIDSLTGILSKNEGIQESR